MKSRLATASASRAVDAVAAALRRETRTAAAAVPVTARAPSSSGQAASVAMLHPTAMQANTATWTRLSPQKSSRAPPGDSRNLSRASSPSHPSRIEWVRNSRPPATCRSGSRERKKGAPSRPTARLTRVIAFGVMEVATRRRVIASEMRRST